MKKLSLEKMERIEGGVYCLNPMDWLLPWSAPVCLGAVLFVGTVVGLLILSSQEAY